MAQDYYQLLSLDPGADAALIDKAYRLLARRHHPDTGEHADPARFEMITLAWRVLADPVERRRYDRLFSDRRRTTGAADPADRDVRQVLPLRFDQAARGGPVTLTRMTPAGPHHLSVNVPAAIEDGRQLRLRGLGLPADRHHPAGDLVLTVSIADHPRFRRRGLDLYVDLAVPLEAALLGGAINTPTLDGDAAIDVPPGSTTGDRLRLRARGLRTADGRRGDLYAVVHVAMPRGPAAESLIAALQPAPVAPTAPVEPVAEVESVDTARRAREAAHAERRAAERLRQADLRHAQLEQWQTQLETQHERITHANRAADQHAHAVGDREAHVDRLAAELHEAERSLVRRQAEVDQLAAQLASRLAAEPVVVEVAANSAAHETASHEADAIEADARLRLRHAEAVSQQAGHRLRLADLREHELRQWQDRLEAHQAIIDGAHALIERRSDELAVRHADQTRRHAELTARRAELADIAQQLADARAALSQQGADVAEREAELDRRAIAVAGQLDQTEAAIAELAAIRSVVAAHRSTRRGAGSPVRITRRSGAIVRTTPIIGPTRRAAIRRRRIRRARR